MLPGRGTSHSKAWVRNIPFVAASLNQLAGLYHAIGDDTAAFPSSEKGLTILRHTFGEGQSTWFG